MGELSESSSGKLLEKAWGSSVFGRRGYQDWQVWSGISSDGGRIRFFALPLIRHVSAYINTGAYTGMGKR